MHSCSIDIPQLKEVNKMINMKCTIDSKTTNEFIDNLKGVQLQISSMSGIEIDDQKPIIPGKISSKYEPYKPYSKLQILEDELAHLTHENLKQPQTNYDFQRKVYISNVFIL